MYEVLYEFKPTNEGDIALHVGDCIDRVKDLGCGWVIGYNSTTGETGHFPADFIQSSSNWKRKFTLSSSKRQSYDVNAEEKQTFGNKTGSRKFQQESLVYEKSAIPSRVHEEIKLPTRTEGRFETIQKEWCSTETVKCAVCKAVLGFLAGLMLGIGFFFMLEHSFRFPQQQAMMISGAVTVLLSAGLGLSTRFRCVVLLMFPSLASGKGRAAILSVITGLLLMGPVTNITNNANEVAVSMACITEKAYNHTQQLQRELQKPLLDIQQQIEEGVGLIEKYTVDTKSLQRQLQTTKTSITNFVSELNQQRMTCRSKIREAKRNCKKVDVFETIDSGIETAIGTVLDGIQTTFSGRRRRSINGSCTGHQNCTKKTRIRRQSSGICDDIFNVAEFMCDIVNIPGLSAEEEFKLIQTSISSYEKLFDVDVKGSGWLIESSANSSQSATQIVSKIKSELKTKIENAKFVITILNRVMLVSIVLLFINAVSYDRNYLSNLVFDNVYITPQFKKIDRDRKRANRLSVLPLRKTERNLYTDSRSWFMSHNELRRCALGLCQVLLHCVICAMVILFDQLLFYLLRILKENGDVQFEFTGASKINIEITGEGLISFLFKTLARSVRVFQEYNSTIDIKSCLPEPMEPDIRSLYVFTALYAVAIVFVFMQGFGNRLLHSIAANFYPETERKRIDYLYRKILVKRQNFVREARQMIMLQQSNEKHNWWERLTSKLSCCQQSPEICTNCEDAVLNMSKCKNANCEASYCDECFVELNKMCPLCVIDHHKKGPENEEMILTGSEC